MTDGFTYPRGRYLCERRRGRSEFCSDGAVLHSRLSLFHNLEHGDVPPFPEIDAVIVSGRESGARVVVCLFASSCCLDGDATAQGRRLSLCRFGFGRGNRRNPGSRGVSRASGRIAFGAIPSSEASESLRPGTPLGPVGCINSTRCKSARSEHANRVSAPPRAQTA